MERYLAIDNVCAWPNLTPMPDGAIIATIFNQPCHGRWEGDVECWASEDGGRIWRRRSMPAPHEPGTNRMNVAAGLAANGDLVVLASGWTHRPPRGEAPADHAPPAHVLPPWVCRSTDSGHTWTRAETMPPPEGRSDSIIPFGDIVPLPDGALGVCIYGWQPPDEHNCYFYASDDNGRTWRVRGIIQEGDITETTPLALSNGELLACARTVNDQHLELLRSTDCGRTWQREQAVSQAMQHPAHLLNLADGRILLTYGLRAQDPPFLGVAYRLSSDGGKTWTHPEKLLASGHEPGMAWPASDGGYPSSVQLPDGAILTAYYSSCVPPYHQRYHMGAAIWKLG